MARISQIIKNISLKFIRFYQKTLSFDHGVFFYKHPHGFCRYYPSCSEYAYQAVDKFGLIKGLFKGLRRILRCHPFSAGGYDPIK
jgi:putative membrane protein insertion efficiency factor